ncbi:hypothetical protein [Streptomyces sp. enrichment culture]|uniref:hypothetical protein n=1 Tax=Streptomyces sp. enrichment culture TaxID=1795815 RepID=UPI003F553F8D
MALAEVYSSVYWLAARHRWMDMAELAVTRRDVRDTFSSLPDPVCSVDASGRPACLPPPADALPELVELQHLRRR